MKNRMIGGATGDRTPDLYNAIIGEKPAGRRIRTAIDRLSRSLSSDPPWWVAVCRGERPYKGATEEPPKRRRRWPWYVAGVAVLAVAVLMLSG